ncbi:bifunctional transcriptional activator/DNA repair enzyme AdaA [Cytobacillus horneckiae]|uniref:AraC family transcriptional regulator n=1 Tax=Cytobacillus horneckiae TaxID=549687 RepID=A0A2N0ZCJ0_9BACI|nr:bifunctional transcriptional activator/DNA repair enzyme AdaA [Cytobacillus horneckiae]MCM3180876.1 bifunctional transcriptional activator/DNA repair enzyme AdaA [Cytobacillus horneckiae]MEC1158555.1 bifunctional transcriptional activator/DNA repair enzyme AdaA [Cytobacillus horneckiae]MED2940860.1 bifunctional transcriptional activator/DNA repair enzyme AdaA [Cytobacillus horneckiae]PKG27205.1 AraC family transcriptional regulator [Cytobacillus horneckiae]
MSDSINNELQESEDHEILNDANMMTNEKWQAIIDNDASYNNQFFYAVKTTGIFCKPSCKSRVPKKENVRIFLNAEQALHANFRPCKRCKPTNERLPDSEWVALITEYIDKNFIEKLTLETLADIAHGSPYHLHRTFKKIKGITPVEYIQQVRVNAAKKDLIQTNKAIADISICVGMPNTPYFITLFKKKTGHTPAQYRQLRQMSKMEEL